MDGIALRGGEAGILSREQGDRWQLGAASFATVDTGDPLPPGADTVVERERVEYAPDGSAWITGPAPRGLHVRTRGEDFGAGQPLVPAGHRFRPVDLAAASAGGHAALEVIRRPTVAIIPTGDEIRPAGSDLGQADITDSNSIMLAAQAVEAGARPLVSDVQPDDPGTIAGKVRQVARAADVVLIIAGSSAGRRDHTAAVLSEVGGLTVRGVAVRPGHPVLLGHARTRPAGDISSAAVPVIGVPGYPLAAAVIFELFAVPLLAALHGVPHAGRARSRVQLACDWTSSAEVEDWVPVMLRPSADADSSGGTEVTVATPSGHGAGAITRLLRADAWWPIPIGQAKFARGEYIDVQRIPGLSAGPEGDSRAGMPT
jgi:putative molybdopterin biosynthesis protein